MISTSKLIMIKYIIDPIVERSVFPGVILVIGGGRWARVITSVLCDFLPKEVPISMFSSHGYFELINWKNKTNIGNRVSILECLPYEFKVDFAAVIVANSSSDHSKTGRWALEKNAAVLIEKPFGLCLSEVQALSDFASKCGGLLAPAHVLRFNRSLQSFADLMPSYDSVLSIEVEWIDPIVECRYGENKKYDPAVPIYLDCLPHIVSILQSVSSFVPIFNKPPIITNGGSKVVLPLIMEGIPCNILMQRNGYARVRCIRVESTFGVAKLDFSVEPGTITVGSERSCADLSWNTSPRPLHMLLQTFLTTSMTGTLDSRFSLDTAFAAVNISDQVKPFYLQTVVPWLVEKLKSTQNMDDSSWYALTEILQIDLRQSLTQLDATLAVELLRKQLRILVLPEESPQFISDFILRLYRNDITTLLTQNAK
jgi:hypothetical protein